MDTIITEFDRKFELLLEAQINTVIQLKPKQPNPEDQPGPSHRGEKRKERRSDEAKQERALKRSPVLEEVARAKERLDHLAKCKNSFWGCTKTAGKRRMCSNESGSSNDICPLPEERTELEAIIEKWTTHQGPVPECARSAH
ncbi:hypothetical protein Aduo_018656 [Ancylostoma duodenale]